MAEGDVSFEAVTSPYKMTSLTYTEEDFDKLLNLCVYNVQNNRELIFQALRTALERKKVSEN